MPMIEGPTSNKRRILNSVIHSIILYEAPIYLVLKYKKYREMLLKTQRHMIIRIISAYRTISDGASYVSLLIKERRRAYEENESLTNVERKLSRSGESNGRMKPKEKHHGL